MLNWIWKYNRSCGVNLQLFLIQIFLCDPEMPFCLDRIIFYTSGQAGFHHLFLWSWHRSRMGVAGACRFGNNGYRQLFQNLRGATCWRYFLIMAHHALPGTFQSALCFCIRFGSGIGNIVR